VLDHTSSSPEDPAGGVPVQAGMTTAPFGSVSGAACSGIVAGRKSPVTRAKMGECPTDRRSAAPVPLGPGCAASCGRPPVLSSTRKRTSTWWLIPRGCKNVFEYQLYSGERVEERPLAHRGSAQRRGSRRRHSFQTFLPSSARTALRAKEERVRAEESKDREHDDAVCSASTLQER
jgi:hypothetical protein